MLVLLSVMCADAENFSDAKYDLTVDANGAGDVKTVGEAIAKVPENNSKRYTIFIKKGVYKEQIRIPATKSFISLIGESAENTTINIRFNQ